jgi:hypothetical protein
MMEVWATSRTGLQPLCINLRLTTKNTNQIVNLHIYDALPIKLGTMRPSESLPVGCLKKVSPYGQEMAPPSTLPLRYWLLPASKRESPNINKALWSPSGFDSPWQLIGSRRLTSTHKRWLRLPSVSFCSTKAALNLTHSFYIIFKRVVVLKGDSFHFYFSFVVKGFDLLILFCRISILRFRH